MADLHDALRPSSTPSPPSVEELAARARRRKRHRVRKATGGAVVAAAIATVALAGLPRPPQSVTVADGVADDRSDGSARSTAPESDVTAPADAAPPSTTEPTDTSQATTQGAESENTAPSTSVTEPDDTAPDQNSPDTVVAPHPRQTPGLQTTVTTTSRWDDGYCFQIDLVNGTTHMNTWSLPIELDGTVATIWNAVVVEDEAGTSVFAGEDGYNTEIGPGALTSFGACVDTD